MAKTKRLPVRISDEFEQLLESAWRHLPRNHPERYKNIQSKSDFVIGAILDSINSTKTGKDFIKEFKKDVQEIEYWQRDEVNEKNIIQQRVKYEEYFAKRKKK